MLMAVYFMRETDLDTCTGRGACAEICPVDAVKMADEQPAVDQDWCIGCSVCAVSCPTDAISIRRRSEHATPKNFADLHDRIKLERGLG
jgi:Fe-S-cluster-containing hydrogenase component 2